MCARRRDDPVTPLCRFAFKNGRRCASPAHPDFDGLCYNHGTLAARASGPAWDRLRRLIGGEE